MIVALSAALLSLAILFHRPEPVPEPAATGDAATMEVVESPPPLPAVRRRQTVELPSASARHSRHSRQIVPATSDRQLEKRREAPKSETAATPVAPPVPAPLGSKPVAVRSKTGEGNTLPVYGQQRSTIRDLLLPMIMLAGGAAILARVLNRTTEEKEEA